MKNETRHLLTRWQALEKDDGLRRASASVRLLWIVGLVLFLFVAFGVVYRIHPAAVAVGAAILGWVTAERNALRTRVAQWPIFKRYIDWKRVQEDLNKNDHAA